MEFVIRRELFHQMMRALATWQRQEQQPSHLEHEMKLIADRLAMATAAQTKGGKVHVKLG